MGNKKSISILLGFMIMTAALTGCQSAGTEADGQGKNVQAEAVQEDAGQKAAAKEEVFLKFRVKEKEYTVTAVNTMEKHMVENPWGEQHEKYIYRISLKDKEGGILQQFFHDGVDEEAELYCDDLNFDGFPDLEIVSWHRDHETGGEIYLWDQNRQCYFSEGIDLPRSYKVYADKKVFTLGAVNEIICRINENGKIEELRSFTLNTSEKTLRIYDGTEDKFLVNEKIELDENDKPVNEEDYRDIFWSGIPDSGQEIKTYFSVDAEDYNVSLSDLVPGESLKMVISKGDHDTTAVRVYRKEADYESPDEFTAGIFENLLGHNGFYIYDYFCGMWNLAEYYALEDDELICLAESWGGEPSDYMIDVDGDGDNELICNVMYLGDGAQRTVIYDYDGKQVLRGSLDGLLDEEYDDYGVWSTGSEYLPDENVVKIRFWRDELEDFCEKKYEVDMDKIAMAPFVWYP